MGRILKQVHSELLESRYLQLVEQVKDHDDSRKHKEVSPLLKAAKHFGLTS